MKKFILITLSALLMLTMIGCDDDDNTEDLIAPTNLTLSAESENSLRLTWNASADAEDGYIVYFDNEVIDTVTVTSIVHVNVTRLGTYEVTALKEENESDPVEASSELITGTSSDIYYLSAPVGFPSGYGWDADGAGHEYNVGSTANPSPERPFIHMVLNSDMLLDTPDNVFDGGKETWFKSKNDVGYDNIEDAPWPVNDTNYGAAASTDLGDAFVAAVEIDGSTYFVKFKTSALNETDNSIQIEYGFQAISGFVILK